mmetsp:Transcript_30864/g.92060  ORF Transcript_30864/g.92060 Transcript_30864/m.92060 type:complete len:152 (-) Transcript_30864:712-1167(-)
MLRSSLRLTSRVPAASQRLPRPSLLARRGLATKFSKDHEWVKVEGEVATVGITDHAQEQLGDVVFVDLPEVGAQVTANDTMGAVESVKAASDVYAPVSGEVTDVNGALNDEPALINSSAESDGWMCKIKLSTPGELDGLMDADAYKKFCDE